MSAASDPPRTLTGLPLILTGVLLGLANLMVVLDLTIANVSVPHISGALAVSPAQGTWVVTSYAVAEAISVPLTGWLAQRFGAVKVFVSAMIGFGACSLLCGLAPTFAILVASRVLQGLCGGPIMPMSQTLLLHIFPKDKGPQALGLWVMTTVIGPIAGPTLGGLISDSIGWSWIFFINVPVAAIIVPLAIRALSSHETPVRRVPVDYVGLGLLVLWVGAMQIMLDKGRELDWFQSPTIVVLGLTAVVGFIAFLIWELTAENPIVDLRIFRYRAFCVGVAGISLVFGAFFATVVLIPLWLQTSMGYTATSAGYVMSFQGMLAICVAPIVGRLVARYDPRILVSGGVLWFACIALWRGFFTTDVTFRDVALPQLALGLSIPFFFIPTQQVALSAVKPQEMASAAGLMNFLRTSAGAFGASIMTTLWDNTASAKHAVLAGGLAAPQATIDALTARGLTHDQALAQLNGLVTQQSVMLATNRMFLVSAAIFVLAAAGIWLAPKPARLGAPTPGH